MTDWIGYRWLGERFNVAPVQPLAIESELGTSRRTMHMNGTAREIYTAAWRPADTIPAHLTFALKHEGVHLEFLSRLFQAIPEAEIVSWVNDERTGQYARRVGFLWEWLNERPLHGVEAVTSGNYVEALDPADYLVSTAPSNNARWRVRDNLPGTPYFCPIVRRTAAVEAAAQYNCGAQLEALQAEYGADLIMRSAVWLTIKESRASFEIEHEQDKRDKIRRFAAVMERRCGEAPNPLARDALAELQQEVIGDKPTFPYFGLRRSPVFVGETSGFQEVIHYVAPHFDELEPMIQGMETFIAKTGGASPIARAAVAAFGFVYIHPLADGNGRVHRFLINDMLRRDGAVPRPFILPVSATITDRAQNRAAYDAVLELLSKPFMARYGGLYELGGRGTEYEDKIRSNFVFTGYDDAAHTWRFPDLTGHVEYLARLIDETIRLEMRHEADLLRRWEKARAAVKEVIEGPNTDIDRIIRGIQGNGGKVSGKLAGEFPVLERADVAEDVESAVADAFDNEEGLETSRRAAAGPAPHLM